MLTTHKDFKSLNPNVQDAETMDKYVGEALCYQHRFYRWTTSREKSQWDEQELRNFQVDLEKIDRLYHIDYDNFLGFQSNLMIGRMDYNGQPVFFNLYVTFKIFFPYDVSRGRLFVSRDAKLFVKVIFSGASNCYLDRIRQSLAEDGICLGEISEYDIYHRRNWRSPPTLAKLCHLTVWEHGALLIPHCDDLPKTLQVSIDEIIRVKEANKDYHSMDYIRAE